MATKAKGKYYRQKVRHPVTGEYRDVYAKSKPELKTKCDALEAAWARQIEDAESPYFWQYAAEWFARVSPDMSEGRKTTIAREINSFICPVIGQKKLRELTSDDVMDVMAAREARSRSARRNTLQTLNRILEAAEDAGKLHRNPARKISAGGEKPKKKKALTMAQQETLLKAVEGQRIRLFILIGIYTGLRREEICGLRWGDLTLEGKAPHLDVQRACRWPDGNTPVVAEYLKSDAGWRTIPLPEILLRELRAQREALGDLPQAALRGRCVLGDPDGSPWTLKSFQRAWEAVEARSAGVTVRRRKDPETGKMVRVEVEKKLGDKIQNHPIWITLDFECTPHTLRRTYITRLILGGVDLKRVQYLAGHETPDITLEYYTDLQDHQPEDLIGDIRGIFDGPGENEGKKEKKSRSRKNKKA